MALKELLIDIVEEKKRRRRKKELDYDKLKKQKKKFEICEDYEAVVVRA